MTEPAKPREIKIKEHTVLVDEEDWPMLSRYTWHIKPDKKAFYAATSIFVCGRRVSMSMHRLITGMRKVEIDHKNRNGLDNRKENLRYASVKQNQCNRVRPNKYGYRGVFKTGGSTTYAYQIQFGEKKMSKYGFRTPEEAARAYDQASKELHGEFGIRNFKD